MGVDTKKSGTIDFALLSDASLRHTRSVAVMKSLKASFARKGPGGVEGAVEGAVKDALVPALVVEGFHALDHKDVLVVCAQQLERRKRRCQTT